MHARACLFARSHVLLFVTRVVFARSVCVVDVQVTSHPRILGIAIETPAESASASSPRQRSLAMKYASAHSLSQRLSWLQQRLLMSNKTHKISTTGGSSSSSTGSSTGGSSSSSTGGSSSSSTGSSTGGSSSSSTGSSSNSRSELYDDDDPCPLRHYAHFDLKVPPPPPYTHTRARARAYLPVVCLFVEVLRTPIKSSLNRMWMHNCTYRRRSGSAVLLVASGPWYQYWCCYWLCRPPFCCFVVLFHLRCRCSVDFHMLLLLFLFGGHSTYCALFVAPSMPVCLPASFILLFSGS